MICGIYLITNVLTGKSYVGQSRNIMQRWKLHKSKASNRRDKGLLAQAIREYGIANFKFKIVEECNRESLNDREEHFIKRFKTAQPLGYNMLLGATHKGYRKTDEAKRNARLNAEWRKMQANRPHKNALVNFPAETLEVHASQF